MLRLSRPLRLLFKSCHINHSLSRSRAPITASFINLQRHNFAGFNKKDLNHPHLNPTPGEDPTIVSDDNPFLWDPHWVPCEEDDYWRHHYILDDHEKGRWAIHPLDQVRNLEPREVLKRVSKVLYDMERAQTEQKVIGHNTHLYNDLGLDSLDQVEFGLAIEREFDIEIGDEEAEQVLTVGDAVELILENPAAK
mmetsp:Transcript_6281/g.10362  ORF Transcript_6281/g.10362 Transcript_6281/m.10362 type:complete len:194 (+) Transcript_6281:78-659(+)|eukprot:CAMPEP_0197042472 /NCGR_PEP_ID=MMETSP1384-20130603/18842_1 /TAXON_ID=29189 /ORGANISM="Ammonia sp." /LENGTH=193 /DNA_ID=CAMNT_0042473579 /DNA_START=58 /DNA_END=639 /DNA_ORIENTATION=+